MINNSTATKHSISQGKKHKNVGKVANLTQNAKNAVGYWFSTIRAAEMEKFDNRALAGNGERGLLLHCLEGV